MQEALEAHDGASKGKYTIGLGQDCMAFCSEVEDVISMRYSFFYVISLEQDYWSGVTNFFATDIPSLMSLLCCNGDGFLYSCSIISSLCRMQLLF